MSSPGRGKTENSAKNKSVVSEVGARKSGFPVATSTPIQSKSGNSGATPATTSPAIGSRSKVRSPCCSPVVGKTPAQKNCKKTATDQRSKCSNKEKPKLVNQPKTVCLPPTQVAKERYVQQERLSKSITPKPHVGSVIKKSAVPPSNISSGQPVKKSQNGASKTAATKADNDHNGSGKGVGPKKTNRMPSIVVECVGGSEGKNSIKNPRDTRNHSGRNKPVSTTTTTNQPISTTTTNQPLSTTTTNQPVSTTTTAARRKSCIVKPSSGSAIMHTTTSTADSSSDSSQTLSPDDPSPTNDKSLSSHNDNKNLKPTYSGSKVLYPDCKLSPSYEALRPLSPSIPVRRRLSFIPSTDNSAPGSYAARRRSEVAPTRESVNFDLLKRGNNSADSLKDLNQDLRDQVTKMRYHLDSQRGSIRQTQWQKVVELRLIRQQEQQRLNVALSDQYQKLDKDKQRELDHLRGQLTHKFESELQKSNRFKDAEISKLKLELSSKDAMLQRLLGDNRHARMKLDIDDRKLRLIDELKQLRQAKKDLRSSLENASYAERAFSNNLRRHSESFECEVARVKKEAQTENRQLIEQLKNKDKLISQLEKDLGRQSWGTAAHFAVLERRRSEGNPLPPGGIDLSQPFPTLPEGSGDPNTFLWTPTSIQTPGDVEDAWTKSMEGSPLGKQDSPSQLKGAKDRNKGLVEKCRSYLQQNKELTAQNRAFKESTHRAAQDTKNAQELLEHSKLQMLQMSRQISQLKAERSTWEIQMRNVESLRQELVEDKKMVNALRKACSDKDRRIELIQHRKKRRRMIESAEKVKIHSAGLKETPFGYEEDDRQLDGNQSVCSFSSTISDDSVWDDVLSKEEMERNYQRLMIEQLELQKSHALLQRQTDSLQDPQRENLCKTDLQNDLFLSQCRIEQLEHFIREGLQGKSEDLWEERERNQTLNKNLKAMVKNLEQEKLHLRGELTNLRERNEDMEFRLIELEQCREKEVPCQDTNQKPSTSTLDKSTEYFPSSQASGTSVNFEVPAHVRETGLAMEQLAKDLNALLKDKGKDGQSALKKLQGLIEKEKSLEGMAHELQMKVISLQQEKNSLQDRMLLVDQSQPGKKGNSASLAEAKERQENLVLKAAIESQSELVSERVRLQEQLKDLKEQNESLRHHIDALNHQHHQQPVNEGVVHRRTHPSFQATGSSIHGKGKSSVKDSTLSRKPSDRKSKSRDGTDPTTSKKRKNSPDTEFNDKNQTQFKRSVTNSKSLDDFRMPHNVNSNEEIGTMTDDLEENDVIQSKMINLEQELSNIKNCNDDLTMQLQETVTKKLELESSHQLLQERLSSMEEGFDLLHKENVALGNQLRQRVEEFQITQDERNPRESELEEFCEDLQDRLKEAENCERQLREKVKLFEKSIEEAEIHEMNMRDRCEQLLAGDFEAKKQIQDLQRTGLELRDIVLEREIVEQALRDKVDFLQKAEAASVERIEELESIVDDLRQQLDDTLNGKSSYQKQVHQMTEMKHQMTFLEMDNKALSSRVAELEENEEILRENWRRVAEEDFKRTQSLEEKVKMLEGLNRDLKIKLKDAQEYLVVDMSNVSLAAELAESESKQFDDSSDDDDVMRDVDDVDSPPKGSGSEPEKKVLTEKIWKLERQLSEVAEKKNTKIESLQDKLVDFKETEIKLSETISEMEMTERELRAKLDLYESSEVTVEKMLKYQSKIEELRTSQESLLDQLEIKENQEMTMQEKIQEMERTLRGKIVTLEVEMKGYKQRELKNAGKIRELEKQEKELSEKVGQQAEKENSLYVRISALMDESKKYKTELESVRKQMEDKEDKVRQAKLLEVKLLEIEMECGKKVSTLNAKLRHREEEFRQKESAYEEQISTLQDVHQHKSKLEDEFARKEHDIQDIKMEKDKEIASLSSQISEFRKKCDEAASNVIALENELKYEREKVNEKESMINNLKEEIESKVKNLECVVMEKESEHEAEKESLQSEIHLKERRVSELAEELKEAQQKVLKFENNEKSRHEVTEAMVANFKSFNDEYIYKVEQAVESKISTLETKLESLQTRISDLKAFTFEQCMKIREVEAERDEQRLMFEEGMLELEKEKDVLQNELRNEISALNSRLEQEMNKKESELSDLLKESQEREASLCFDVSNLQHQVEQHKHELIAKLSELEAKNKAHCELSLELSNVRHEHKILQKELDKSKQSYCDATTSLKFVISQKDEQLNQSENKMVKLNTVIEDLKSKVSEKENIIDRISSEKDAVIETRSGENKALLEGKSQMEKQFTEKCQELDRIDKLHAELKEELVATRRVLSDKDVVIQKQEQEKGEKETKLQETESHIQTVRVDKESLTQELQSVKTVLEGAQSQIAHQQQELQLLHSQLQSHQEDNKQFQLIIKEKEEKLQEKDQMYQQKSTELKKLNEQLQDRDRKIEQADFKVADVELKLQKAENRVRELESLHVSLEMRLEERYSVSQNAEKVLRSKELQCSEMENKLEIAEKNLTNLKDQVSVGNESSRDLLRRLETIENQLEMKKSELVTLEQKLEEREATFSSWESKYKQLESEFESVKGDYGGEKERLETMICEKVNLVSTIESRFEERDSDVKQITSELDLTKNALREKEEYCNECETQLSSLRESHSDLKSKHEDTEHNLFQVSQQLDQKNLDLDELQRHTKERDSDLNQCKEQLSKNSRELSNLLSKLEETEKLLSDKMSQIENVNEENQHLKQTVDRVLSEKTSVSAREELLHHELQSKEEKNKIVVSKLESDILDLAATSEVLRKENSDLREKIKTMENDLSQINQHNLEVAESKDSVRKKLSEAQNDKESLLVEIDTLKASESNLSKQLSEVQNDKESLLVEIDTLKASESNLSKQLSVIQNDKESFLVEIDTLKSSESNLSKQLSEVQNDNEHLLAKMDTLKADLSVCTKKRDEVVKEVKIVNEKNEQLEANNERLQANNEQLQANNEQLEANNERLQANNERLEANNEQLEANNEQIQANNEQLEANNEQLQNEMEEAAKEFQSLTMNFEESKTSIGNKVQEITKGKQQVEENFEALQKEHTTKISEMSEMLEGKDKDIEELKKKCNDLAEDNAVLVSNVESFKLSSNGEQNASKLSEVGNVEDEIVCEAMVKVNMAPTLHSVPPLPSQSLEGTGKLLGDGLEAVRDENNGRDQHLLDLESTLNVVKEQEKQLQRRVCELETVEKELREQIVDIEMTVIVPLENENQDLKDEIGMVKQERDEAISKISRWDDDDDDDVDGRVQESETVHQRLEDALIYGEELEKKNEILSNDIQKLENEKENLHLRMTDLEASENERKDEIQSLQEELQSLHEDHKDTSVLEETETTLMDKVLDLEERERNLIQELETLRKTVTDPGKDWTCLEDVNEKMKYLEQKNQILEDAEGRFMDKIMELEEDKHRLLSELSSITHSHTSQTTQSPHIPHTCVNIISVSISTQTSVPFEANPVLGATDSSDGVDSSYHSDTLSSSGQIESSSTHENSVTRLSVLEDQLAGSKAKIEEVDAHLREKEALIVYLKDKLELLQESEGKLMDKLLEAEEKASGIMHSKYSSEITELNKRIENILEENEFLAENVEQYKKSFKEEKERCNNLQDRLMEDSVNVAELQKSQEELVKTQQMVEEIQSEYEEQLSEHLENENKLKEELSVVVRKKYHLEQTVNAKAKREEELLEQVESLKLTEKELRSRLTMVKTEDDDSTMSDSGVSADDPRIRNEHTGLKDTGVIEEPVIHRSVKTVQLAAPSTPSNNPSPAPENQEPVPLPRYKRKLRLSSIEKISQEELIFLVEDLQEREAALKKRVSDLQAVDESELSQKVVELESEKLQLERKLRYVELQGQQSAPSHNWSSDPSKPTSSEVDSYQDFTSGISSTSGAMLEKPEDVLNQRIKELEGLDKHNKNMVSELERDREVLHEIARKDKATIHDLNVKIRELQLSERSLKEQVSNLEVSENSFFNKCEDLEVLRVQHEDRIHELEIHERRLRELVRKLKLDEERWLSKSGGMENAVAELSANEAQLKRIVQDMEMEKGGLSERAEYMKYRIQEMESVEVSLLARVKDYENNEVIIQNRLVQLENAEAAAHSRASELDVVNVNLSQKHKKMVEENAVMAQHLAQLHGQVQDLDRRLLTSRDSEIAYKQHVESLQKNESLLQKKVREYELREIDSQSAIRELEQMAEINSDKLSALQRSENRLRYRVQELEGVGGQIPGELTPSQQQKVPQNIEDCQKRIVLLQSQVENLKLQLRQALNTTQQQSAEKSDKDEEEKSNNVSIASEEYSQLHVKAALLDEYAYQNEELESNQEQLRDTILQLRQGKGACGHEVEIEVYKRRLESLQTFISKLKSSLSTGQTTSLLESELDSGPQGDTLPARHLQVLESERVLQSVRGLHHNGKADTTIDTNGGVHSTGLAPVEDSMVQAEAVQNMASLPLSMMPVDNHDEKVEQPTRLEESHWKAIEARKPVTNTTANDSRGGVNPAQGRGIKVITSSPRHYGNQPSSTTELEEVTGILNLHSESELSSYQRTTQNDTDSCSSPVPPPRKNRSNRLSKNTSDDNSSNNGSGSDRDHHHHLQYTAHAATANQKHFGDGKSLPLTATNIEKQLSSQQHQQTRAPLSRFAEDSFYLPSSTQEGLDSLEDDDEAPPPPLPSQGPPGQDAASLSGRSSEGRKESLDNSASGLSIRDRIALIERHLQSDTHTGSPSNREEEDQLFYWKRKSTENLRQAETLDKNNKFLKEDINRLEKELEEKRRHINTLELWLSSTEDLLKNKSKQTDREMVEQLQLDLTKLRRELSQTGYRSEDALLDAAALRTEVGHRDREISNKRIEIETLSQELRRCHKECRNIEGMRRTALDSLRSLEKEVLHLQDTEERLKKAQSEINSLKIQYDELDQFKNQALAMVQPLQMKVDRLTKKCREKDILLRRLGADLRRGGLHRPSSALDELTRLERAMNGEEYNTDNSDSISDDLSPRPTNHKLRGRSVSMDELSLYSDTDSLHFPSSPGHTPPKRQRPTPYVNSSRPRSAEAGSVRSPRRVPDHPHKNSRSSIHHRTRGFDLGQEHFVAIADYDPGLYSQSGRPRLELALREGDQVKVTGPMDRLGYCEAECNGRTGLVPANYLQPVHFSGMNGHSQYSDVANRQTPSVIHLDRGIAPPQAFQDGQHFNPNGHAGSRLQDHLVPDPPSNLHVRGIEDGCLVLAWKPPFMDAKGCNKGFQVRGYMVYVDNQEYEQIPNPQYCQMVIESLDPSTSHHLAVQSLCAGGQVSPRAELVFEGMVRLGESLQVNEDDVQGPLDTDLSSVLNSIHYTKGAKKKVMALYEYNPKDQSPHDYTAFELAFHPGDVIAVYGKPRPDGFYHGEMEGKRGLVPACFVEDLSSRHGKQGSHDSGHESSKA